MKETGSAALALTAALITSSTFLPRACSSMYSWMLMLSFGEDRIGAVRRLVRRVVMGARRAVGAEKAAEALIMNAAYEQSPKEKRKKVFFAFFYPEAAVRDWHAYFASSRKRLVLLFLGGDEKASVSRLSSSTPAARPRQKRTMAKRQKTGKTLALFDVDGTLTVPRKVRRERLEVAFSRVHETTPDTTSHICRDRPPPRARVDDPDPPLSRPPRCSSRKPMTRCSSS